MTQSAPRPTIAVAVFPGSNDDRDTQLSLERLGANAVRIWHADEELPEATAAVVLPGGFSYGDYLRCGAIARFSPIMAAVSRFAGDGGLVLGDEAFTPDSSRFWPADEYRAGATPPSFDKQFVRDYCETLGWDKTYPGPALPDDVVAGTRGRYVEAFECLTEIGFDEYVARPEVVLG